MNYIPYFETKINELHDEVIAYDSMNFFAEEQLYDPTPLDEAIDKLITEAVEVYGFIVKYLPNSGRYQVLRG